MSQYKYSKSFIENGLKRNVNRLFDCLPEQAKWLMYEHHVRFHEIMPTKKYREPKIYTGVDALRNLGLVRRYVCQRFKITNNELEILLFIYPYNYFTKKDYDRIAKPYVGCSILQLKKKGHVLAVYKKESLKIEPKKRRDLADVYTLSMSSKRAVKYFYKLISGELKPYQFQNMVYSENETKNNLIKELIQDMREE